MWSCSVGLLPPSCDALPVNPSGLAKPYRSNGDGLLLSVRLTPKSSRDAVDGIWVQDDRTALTARVRAVPEKGKANKALEALIAKWLGVAKSQVSVVAGHTARLKVLKISGDEAPLATALDAKLEPFQ